ncbi:guanine deaminase [Veronia nyctiphanis]|uniref:Guanine deaminase n=1 Tax=Veronia nyctiphanis TaxID=1278244 RepID=A0A4Q0YN78_9GAMM|nr:guanine deaminase [Veronia nyctiphanis]RXJ72390.1 guanine deaminase [Veronia nyctiphanis]
MIRPQHGKIAFRAALLHLLEDPAKESLEQSYQYIDDGILLIEDGHIVALGEYRDLSTQLDDSVVTDMSGKLIVPGFIDTHIHYPQTRIIGAYGDQLLDWLNNYTFPEECRFADRQYAEEVAEEFFDQLVMNGTTTALVFGTVHKHSVDVFFTEAEKRNLRMIGGKVLMDRNAPDALLDTPETGYEDSKALIDTWHNKGRLSYAVTPRFAPTSTDDQLALAGKLLREYPDVYLHTHLSENQNEIEWVQALFPDSKNYLDVYDRHGLVKPRAVFAHGVHVCDDQCGRLAETGAAIAFCPTSNLFLGSGLFPLEHIEKQGVKVGVGTDVGAGTSFSMIETMSEAYKIMQLQGKKLNPLKSLYQITLGGAKALYLDDKIGNFTAGKEADFVVLDLQATDLLSVRMKNCQSVEEKLFVLMTLGDERVVSQTYSMGSPIYSRDS